VDAHLGLGRVEDPAPARHETAVQRRRVTPVACAQRVGGDRGLIDATGPLLEAVDLLEGHHIGVQARDGFGERCRGIVGVDGRRSAVRPDQLPVQHVERRAPHP
jgi:hypothetical protein